MTIIRVKENRLFEIAMPRFKRTIEKNGLLTELRAREFYESRRSSASARK
ncbi:MAG: 30S ribosomal protein S21 [Burkholderia gladioli]|nr:MAG: 30S ribosomal protein S21 [Burkholderia gladioli]